MYRLHIVHVVNDMILVLIKPSIIFDSTDQNVGDRSRSKLQGIFNSTSKEVLFPLYDAIIFKDQGNFKYYRSSVRTYLMLGVS
jgi:hypothetical protein